MYSKVGCNCAHSNTHTISAARFGDVCAHAVAGAGGRVAHVRKRVARVREGAARSSVRARRGAFECGARGAFECGAGRGAFECGARRGDSGGGGAVRGGAPGARQSGVASCTPSAAIVHTLCEGRPFEHGSVNGLGIIRAAVAPSVAGDQLRIRAL